MWNKSKSIALTHLLVRASYVFLAIIAMGMPFFVLHRFEFEGLGATGDDIAFSLFAVVPAGYVALICLDKLLINVKKEVVFNEKNVKLLRIISWACIYAALVGLITFVIIFIKSDDFINRLFALAIISLAVGEMFMGFVVRVVKNVFEAAIEIKEENELTI